MLLYIATIGEFGLNSTTDGSPAVCTLSTGATGFSPSLARGLSGRAIMLLAVYGDGVGIIIGTAFGIGTILGTAFGTAIFAGDGVAELLEYTDSELISSSSSVGTKSWLLAP